MPDRTAPQGMELTLRDGTKVGSLAALAEAVDGMSNEDFSQYVNSQHVFADWVDFCLNDKFLAATIRKASTKEEMHKALFIALFR